MDGLFTPEKSGFKLDWRYGSMKQYELIPTNGQKSFYGKAIVEVDDAGNESTPAEKAAAYAGTLYR